MNIKLASIYHYLFLILCFVIPFQKISSALPNIILIGLVVLFPLCLMSVSCIASEVAVLSGGATR